jgi:hypothetical protein
VIGLAVVAVVAIGVAGYMVTSSDDDSGGGGGPTNTTPSPGADALTVVDKGGAQFIDTLRGGNDYGYALVVSNSSDQAATVVKVTLDFSDAQGHKVTTVANYLNVVPAKSKMGLGGSVNPSLAPVSPAQAASIDHFAVRSVDVGFWEPMSKYGKLLTSSITTTPDINGPRVAFDADSTYKRDLSNPVAHLLFRNPAGKLIGGTTSTTSAFLEAAGHVSVKVQSPDTFQQVDFDKTEVYLEPAETKP